MCITKQKVSLLMKSNLHVMPKSLQNVLPKILRLQLKMQQQTQKKLFLSLMRSTKLLRHQRSWLIKQKLQSQAGLQKRQWKINNDLSIILTSNKFTSSHLFYVTCIIRIKAVFNFLLLFCCEFHCNENHPEKINLDIYITDEVSY